MKRQLMTLALSALLAAPFAIQAQDAATTDHSGPDHKSMHSDPKRDVAQYGHSRNRSDKDLAKMIQYDLQRDKDFSDEAKNIHVKVKNGHASLSGDVRSIDEKDALTQKVKAMDGIKSVDNQLKVRE